MPFYTFELPPAAAASLVHHASLHMAGSLSDAASQALLALERVKALLAKASHKASLWYFPGFKGQAQFTPWFNGDLLGYEINFSHLVEHPGIKQALTVAVTKAASDALQDYARTHCMSEQRAMIAAIFLAGTIKAGDLVLRDDGRETVVSFDIGSE